MKKVIFNWKFDISEDKEDLVVYLNGGVNVMIEIKHQTFYKHLADKLNEILHHEQAFGTKTNVRGFEAVQRAKAIKGE
jgi:hypothetical protein